MAITPFLKQSEIDLAISPGEPFVSTWECKNPVFENSLNFSNNVEHGKYCDLLSSDLTSLVKKFHLSRSESETTNSEVLFYEGASLAISSFCMWLAKNRIKKIYYIPPIYFTFFHLLDLLGIEMTPISSKQGYEEGFLLNLPKDEKSVLIFSDPIWYAGVALKSNHILEISEWQKKTGATLFIDGSFQYMSWDKKTEATASLLDPELTFRLICPTKSLAIHSCRLAYTILPRRFYRELLQISQSISGSTCSQNVEFAFKALNILSSNESNYNLISLIKSGHDNLIKKGLIHYPPELKPTCGYFSFVLPSKKPLGVCMGGECFEQFGYPGFLRINFLQSDFVAEAIANG